MQVLRREFEGADERDRQLINSALHLGVVMDPLKTEFAQGDFLIRNVMGIQRESNGLAIGEVLREGQVVQFHVRDSVSAAEDLDAMLGNHAAAPPGIAGRGRAALLLPRPRPTPLRQARPRYGPLPRQGRRHPAGRLLLQRRDRPGGVEYLLARLHKLVRHLQPPDALGRGRSGTLVHPPSDSDGRAALDYHATTKHSPISIRTNRHSLDWANQPMPFKVYEDLDPIELPRGLSPSSVPALDAIGGGIPVGGTRPRARRPRQAALLLRRHHQELRPRRAQALLSRRRLHRRALPRRSLPRLRRNRGPGGGRLSLRRSRLLPAAAAGQGLSGGRGRGVGSSSLDRRRSGHAGLRQHLLAQLLEIPVAGLPAHGVGQRDHAGEPPRRGHSVGAAGRGRGGLHRRAYRDAAGTRPAVGRAPWRWSPSGKAQARRRRPPTRRRSI